MSKYIMNEKIGLSYNASSKARDDISLFVSRYISRDQSNYQMLGNNDKSKAKFKVQKVAIGIMAILQLTLCLKVNDILFIQCSLKILPQITWIKRMLKFKTIYLIHDLDPLRDAFADYTKNKKMIKQLNDQDVVICHNKYMLRELKRRGCTSHLIDLQIFDYYISDFKRVNINICQEDSICFAGNLSPAKTGFLYKMDECELDYKVMVYGKKEKEFMRLNYSGCFNPEELPEKIMGKYGLIWEGNEFTYNEQNHPYIMYNNPHKASLYIISGIPIIIWERAALANFVEEKNIGFTVSSISEISTKIKKISEKEYRQMIYNLKELRESLMAGEYVHKALRRAEEFLENSYVS